MTTPPISIIDVCGDQALFARWFRHTESWGAWFAFLRTLLGLPLNDGDRALFWQCTRRTEPPTGAVREAWLICGRRAGKSFMLALIAVFLACFCDWSRYLAPGERGVIGDCDRSPPGPRDLSVRPGTVARSPAALGLG